MEAFFKNNPNCSFTLELNILPEAPSEKMVYYYEFVILPELQRGFKEKGSNYELKKIDEMLRMQFVGTFHEKIIDGVFIKELPPIREISKENILLFLDFVRIYAAVNLQTFIQEPRVL